MRAKVSLPSNMLLIVSKAFALQPFGKGEDLLNIDMHNKFTLNDKSTALIQLVFETLGSLQPASRDPFFSLFSGNIPTHVNDIHSMPLARIKAILCANKFAIPDENDIAYCAKRRYWIASLQRLPTPSETEAWEKANSAARAGSGLWIAPSLLNHSCAPNCTWYTIGDFLFVHTTRPIDAGEELLISYCDVQLPYDQRTRIFSRWCHPGNTRPSRLPTYWIRPIH